MNKKILTVFTPTYNRAGTLETLYRSLVAQSDRSFLWLIVDDGSTDGTDAIVEAWQEEKKLHIIYEKQTNQGKMAAHNRGVDLCETELFVCVDSDDYLVPDAVASIVNAYAVIKDRADLAGIIAYKGFSSDQTVGNEFPADVTVSALSLLYRRGFVGDTTLVFKADVIKKYPFPIIEGEKFITEAYIYDQIDVTYQYHLLPQILTICEYRADGYTQNGMRLVFRNPYGWSLYCCQKGNMEARVLRRIRHYGWSVSYRLMSGKKSFRLKPRFRLCYWLSFPLGFLLYARRVIKYRAGKKYEN